MYWPTSAANDEPDILQNSIDAEMMVGGVSFEVITSCAVSEAIATRSVSYTHLTLPTILLV